MSQFGFSPKTIYRKKFQFSHLKAHSHLTSIKDFSKLSHLASLKESTELIISKVSHLTSLEKNF